LENAKYIKRAFYFALAVVIILVGVSFWWRTNSDISQIHNIVRTQADAHLKQDLLYRSWAAGHGGVYVPVTEATPPNEYLVEVLERDIVTPSGRELTLLNPAYMTRQVHELAAKDNGVQGHITSLKPLRLQNAPDEWERKSLIAFGNGDTMSFGLDTLRNEAYFRLMEPLVVEQACLKCHRQQGYVLGDVRGGLSISIPAEPYLDIISEKLFTSAILHVFVLLLLVGLGIFSFRSIIGKLDADAKARVQIVKHSEELSAHNLEYQQLNESLILKNLDYKRLADEYAEQNLHLNSALLKAEESDRLKTSFLCNMSHEIRTPMNGIVGFAQLLASPGLDHDKHGQYLSILNDSCDQLLEVVNDILEISKIETGQIEVVDQTVYLPSVLADLAERWRRKANAKNNVISIIDPIDPEALWVVADELKLNHLLGHLMSNAVKFTEFGIIELSCGINEGQFIVSVSDTGIGIPEELHSSIFERFRKGESFQSYEFGGTGLGLSICKGYAEHMNGKISIVSSLGHGSVFTYSQPYRPAEVKAVGIDAVTEFSFSNISGKIILVAEDDHTNFIYIDEVLRSEGCGVIRASNGAEAVRLIAENPNIDLVLMDINMPIMDGYQATIEIHNIRPEIPVVALTAMLAEDQIKQFLSIGFKMIVSKPIILEKLIAVIKQFA